MLVNTYSFINPAILAYASVVAQYIQATVRELVDFVADGSNGFFVRDVELQRSHPKSTQVLHNLWTSSSCNNM